MSARTGGIRGLWFWLGVGLIATTLAFAGTRLQQSSASILGGVVIRSWTYQLVGARPSQIAASETDLAVIDYSRDGTPAHRYTRGDVERMKRKPNGDRRIVLAYLSIGEAESYRYYWDEAWEDDPPDWLGPENRRWRNNYKVRYWDEDWQRIILGGQGSYIDHIIDAGFDGVYLDIVDGYEDWQDEHAGAADDMVRFVRRIRAAAQRRDRDFLVVSQNGEGLLVRDDFLSAIDAIAKEDLLYGLRGNGVANRSGEIDSSIAKLDLAKTAGKPVLVIEYLATGSKRRAAAARLSDLDYIATFPPRGLDQPTI